MKAFLQSAARACALCAALIPMQAWGAEATTGSIVGSIVTKDGAPVVGARVAASSPSGQYVMASDKKGNFIFLGVAPDTYAVSIQAEGFKPTLITGIEVKPQGTARVTLRLIYFPSIEPIAHVRADIKTGPDLGTATDAFTVSGAAASAQTPVQAGSGLAVYTRGSVQGAIASVPGVVQDQFANVVVRGGKIQDTDFSYDSVPIPQGLIAEPGGNLVGAQLPTTGAGTTLVTLAGMDAQTDNALGGVVDEIPATGTYPGTFSLESSTGIGAGLRSLDFKSQWATPDLRERFAVAGFTGSEDLLYGDGQTFYPAEAGTYGIALSNSAQWSLAGNAHFRLAPNTDLGLVALAGEGTYDQYGSPFSGLTYGDFNGAGGTVFPGEPSPNAPIDVASRFRGTYDVEKVELTHASAQSLVRLQVYRSEYGSLVNGPFWDDLSFPDGAISLYSTQSQRLTGISIDVQTDQTLHNSLRYGAEYSWTDASLFQVIPTADEFITSQPTITSNLLYVSDTWTPTERLEIKGALRATGTNSQRGNGSSYNDGVLDPHLAAIFHFGNYAIQAIYDRNSVAPAPLEVERIDSSNPAPQVNLAPETGRTFELALEGGTRTRFRLSFYDERETNVIDVLPFNYHAAIAAGESPTGVGVPTNIGQLNTHGFDWWLQIGPFTLTANYVKGYSSSASQFAYNDLNTPAVAAGHPFPIGYVPNFTATASYAIHAGKVTIQPGLSFESGYPYGVGTKVWIFSPVTNKPELVSNDNYVNPGYNYYFLRNPAQPFNVLTNPYIGSLGTGEGSDPNTLRTPPQTLLSLHVEAPLTPRFTAMLDVVNVLAIATPTQLQSNPYLIGPPGYTGGNPSYAAYYGTQVGSPLAGGYTLGNGVPTNNGEKQILPWTYGTGGYVPSSFPQARTILLRLRWRM